MDYITQLLGEGSLPTEMVNSLKEAFDKKVKEARKEAEDGLREEFSRRYEHDKSNLVEAIDRMLKDTVSRYEGEKAKESADFRNARDAFRTAVKENKGVFNKKLVEHQDRTRAVVTDRLTKEVAKLHEKRRELVKENLAIAEKTAKIKQNLMKEHAHRISKINEFITKQITSEIAEFHEDRKALVSTRAKLVREGSKKLRETQARFVKEAAKNVERAVGKSLVKEMKQLHEDLERNRQNMFGRRLFETFAAEYMTSHLNEGTEIRKLQESLNQTKAALSSAKTKLAETEQAGQAAARKARLAEDRVIRTKTMGELLSSLRGDPRSVMEGMLETTKTSALRETFQKLLPVVLNEAGSPARKTIEQGKKTLTETRSTRSASLMTGDQRPNRLTASARAEDNDDNNNESATILRLAGIYK